MRNEINESRRWRSSRSGQLNHFTQATTKDVAPTSTAQEPLPAELVDAAFADDTISRPTGDAFHRSAKSGKRHRLMQSISTQLDLLEAQRDQLQRLLDEAQEVY